MARKGSVAAAIRREHGKARRLSPPGFPVSRPLERDPSSSTVLPSSFWVCFARLRKSTVSAMIRSRSDQRPAGRSISWWMRLRTRTFIPFRNVAGSFAEAVEGGDTMPFGVLDPVAVHVPDDPAFRVAGTRGGEWKWVMSVPPLVVRVSGLTDVAGENDDVLHGKSPLLPGGTIPSDETRPRPSGDSCTGVSAPA